jgi:hypothetical protein
MKHIHRHRLLRRASIALGAFGLIGILFDAGATRAAELPGRPGDTTPVPVVSNEEHFGYLALDTSGLKQNALSIVQWQDPSGGWHDVEGWQHPVSPNVAVRWTVYPRDFGKGSFRWAIVDRGQVIAASASFMLPAKTGDVVNVSVR